MGNQIRAQLGFFRIPTPDLAMRGQAFVNGLTNNSNFPNVPNLDALRNAVDALNAANTAAQDGGKIAKAAQAYRFVAENMTRGDRLGHSWRESRLLFPGLASDFACMTKAALALHEATGERSYLDRALTWQHALDRHYANPDNGGYFFWRKKPLEDLML